MCPTDSTPKLPLDESAPDPADHDPLTGLRNRRRFENDLNRHLTHIRADSERPALLLIDVDRYREVIHQHGPAAAEGLIRSIAEVLAKRLAPNETLARIGGDEFAAILTGMAPRLVQGLADDLCTAVREQMHTVGSSLVHATVSIGAVLLGPSTRTHQSALSAAETALHEAKIAGSDRCSTSVA